jgi:hypothetical protein
MSETMELPVPSNQRPSDHYHYHTLERRTYYQGDYCLTRSDNNRYSVTSEVPQTSRSSKRREHMEHYEEYKSASVHNRQQTRSRSRSPRPRTHAAARANGRLPESSHHQIDSQEHHVRRVCVKHQDDAACRCNSNARIARAGES